MRRRPLPKPETPPTSYKGDAEILRPRLVSAAERLGRIEAMLRAGQCQDAGDLAFLALDLMVKAFYDYEGVESEAVAVSEHWGTNEYRKRQEYAAAKFDIDVDDWRLTLAPNREIDRFFERTWRKQRRFVRFDLAMAQESLDVAKGHFWRIVRPPIVDQGTRDACRAAFDAVASIDEGAGMIAYLMTSAEIGNCGWDVFIQLDQWRRRFATLGSEVGRLRANTLTLAKGIARANQGHHFGSNGSIALCHEALLTGGELGDRPNMLQASKFLAFSYGATGQQKKRKRALDLASKLAGSDRKAHWSLAAEIASTAADLGDPLAGLAILRKTRVEAGADPRRVARCLEQEGKLLSRLGRHDEGLEQVRLSELLLPQEHLMGATLSALTRAEIHWRSGQWDKAAESASQVVRRAESGGQTGLVRRAARCLTPRTIQR